MAVRKEHVGAYGADEEGVERVWTMIHPQTKDRPLPCACGATATWRGYSVERRDYRHRCRTHVPISPADLLAVEEHLGPWERRLTLRLVPGGRE